MNQNCKVCENEIFFDHSDGKWKMRIENANWDYYHDCYDYDDIEINFCYGCGHDYRND